MTIVLADDHQVVRQGLRLLLQSEPDFQVVGEEADGLKITDLVQRLKPRVLVVDLGLPGINGLEVTRQVVRRAPGTRVVVLSMHASDAYVLEALRNGASAYVLKEASATELVRAIREVLAGRRYLSPPLSDKAIEAYVRRTESDVDPYQRLTGREREVLQLVAEGLSSTEIAGRLGISPRTAESHRSNVMSKLGLRGRTDLIRYALKRGILPMEAEPRKGPAAVDDDDRR